MDHGEAKHFAFTPEDEPFIRVTQPGGILHERFQDGVKVERRSADDLEDFPRGRLVLERFREIAVPGLELLEQPGVLHGDRGVRRKHLQHLDHLRVDAPAAPLVVGREQPDAPSPRDHWDDHEALGADGLELRVGRLEAQIGGQRVLLVEEQGHPLAVRFVHRPRVGERDLYAQERFDLFLGEAGRRQRHEPFVVRGDGPDVEAVDLNDLARGLEHAGELLL